MSFFDKLRKNVAEEDKIGEEASGLNEKIEEKSEGIIKKEGPKRKKKIKVEETEKTEAEQAEAKTEKKKWFESEGQLAVDVFQTDGELVIQAAIAGVKPEDLDISIERDVVIIRGRREKPIENGEENYFYQECYWGPFSREIILPEEIDAAHAEATMKEGILTVRMPKLEIDKKRKIMINTEQ